MNKYKFIESFTIVTSDCFNRNCRTVTQTRIKQAHAVVYILVYSVVWSSVNYWFENGKWPKGKYDLFIFFITWYYLLWNLLWNLCPFEFSCININPIKFIYYSVHMFGMWENIRTTKTAKLSYKASSCQESGSIHLPIM